MYCNQSLLDLSVISGTSHPSLAHEICVILNRALRKEIKDKELDLPSEYVPDVEVLADCGKFPNDEGYVQIKKSIRNQHVFILQTACPPIDYHFMQLLMLIDAACRASAKKITVVMPRYFYARSDKKDKPRIPISAKLVADLIETAGANRIVTIELHSQQTQGYFKIFDNFYAGRFLCNAVMEKFKIGPQNVKDFVTAAADFGSAKLNTTMADTLGIKRGAIIDKGRINSFNVTAKAFVGNVRNKIVIAFDDESLTGGTAIMAAQIFKQKGAKEVHFCFFQPVFTPEAIEKIDACSEIDSVLAMDTMPLQGESKKIKLLPSAPLLAEVIRRVHVGESVSDLF